MASEYGWLIEDSDQRQSPMWLRILNHGKGGVSVVWTNEAVVALRFARKEDAENFWHLNPQRGVIPVITEHAWDDIRPAEPKGE